LGWCLVIIVIALGLAIAVTAQRPMEIALAGVGLVSLAVNLFAVKGALTWGQFADQIPNIRVGGYCAIAGYLVAVALGGLRVARR
jgi:hypothetical protein